jgi:hypothetical protein
MACNASSEGIRQQATFTKDSADTATDAWIEVEEYVMGASGNLASHGICPTCYVQVAEGVESFPTPAPAARPAAG